MSATVLWHEDEEDGYNVQWHDDDDEYLEQFLSTVAEMDMDLSLCSDEEYRDVMYYLDTLERNDNIKMVVIMVEHENFNGMVTNDLLDLLDRIKMLSGKAVIMVTGFDDEYVDPRIIDLLKIATPYVTSIPRETSEGNNIVDMIASIPLLNMTYVMWEGNEQLLDEEIHSSDYG